VSPFPTLVISSEHAVKILPSQRSRTLKARWAVTVRESINAIERQEQEYWLSDTTVDFDNFQRVLNRPGGFRDPGEPEEYCRGFQVFDKELTGFIGVGQFRYILTNLGEKMSDDEVDELLKAVDTSSGELNYMGKSRMSMLHTTLEA
jgi:Ca2+-binding EF-hand superfamily protein